MTGPRVKRQFAGAASDPSQRQITSYFERISSPASSNRSVPPSTKTNPLNAPTLPAQVQTDLLTVGMRVRKAIPEGYKTGTYTSLGLWSDNGVSAPSAQSAPSSTPIKTSYNSSIRELEPFCGIHKIGGLLYQPSYSSRAYDDTDENSVPGLSCSQDTVISTASSATPYTSSQPRKRFFTPEDEENDPSSLSLPHAGPFRLHTGEGWNIMPDDEISPRSVVPSPGSWDNVRVLAVPRRSRLAQQHQKGMEQQSLMIVDGNDFEEAPFLDYRIRGSGGMDVE